jgi:carbon storage regulator
MINQSIMICDDIRIVVVAVDRDQVKLGIEAPRSVPVHRSEVYEEIRRSNQEASGATPVLATGGKAEKATLRPRK